jgi:hypothetical protein
MYFTIFQIIIKSKKLFTQYKKLKFKKKKQRILKLYILNILQIPTKYELYHSFYIHLL